MQVDTEEILLDKCRKLIEERLGWGNSDEWTTQDYETLSRKILEKTSINLSIATLKRIWGKIRYDSKPTITTLNTLAQYLDYENWRTFRQKHAPLSGNGHSPTTNGQGYHQKESSGYKRSKKETIMVLTGAVSTMLFTAAVLFYFLVGDKKESDSVDAGLFKFSSKKVIDVGVPNSVIFNYDATASLPGDSIFIQQSWDRRLSTLVSRDGKQHTSIYYYPGFFQAKLRVNDRVVKEHNLFIKTNGWLPLVSQEKVPVYFKADDIKQSGFIRLDLEKLKQANIDLQPTPPWVEYHFFREMDNIQSTDFVFETEFKNDYADGAAACQHTEVRLLFEGGVLGIPLSARGCVSELNFMNMDGKKADLSRLGCDFSKWAKVVFQVKDSLGSVSVNDTQPFTFEASGNPIRMVGFVFRFQGTGSVNYIRIRKEDGEILFEENF